MRLFFFLAILTILVTVVAAWDKEDYEIFDIVSALENAEGKGTTFYSWLDVPSTASTAEIAKAYRKKSVQLHPDKNPGVKGAHERFARLGVISGILRNSESRKRYDFFYKNGVPVWRGTGYYYSRFRPGLGTVFVFLALVTSGIQYLVQSMTYKRDLGRIEWIIEQARNAAWGSKTQTLEGKRKVKVNLGGGPRLDEDGNVIGGRMVDMVVEGSHVYILEPDGSLLPVNQDTAVPPSVTRTWPVALAKAVYRKITQSLSPATENNQATEGELDESDDATSSSDAPGSGTVTPREDAVPQKGGRAAATIAGGRRRKAVRKR